MITTKDCYSSDVDHPAASRFLFVCRRMDCVYTEDLAFSCIHGQKISGSERGVRIRRAQAGVEKRRAGMRRGAKRWTSKEKRSRQSSDSTRGGHKREHSRSRPDEADCNTEGEREGCAGSST